MSGLLRRFFPAARPVRRRVTFGRPTSPKARLLVRALEDRVVPTAYTVLNANDAGPGSLRQAIIDANANPGADAIGFDPATFGTPQTISLLTALPAIGDGVNVTGPGSGLLTVRRDPTATAAFGILTIDGPGVLTVTVSGMTITGGTAGGVRMADEAVTLDGLVVANNSVQIGTGGGIAMYANGTLTVRNSTVAGNTAGGGGGIYFRGPGPGVLENSTVSGNMGGGVQAGFMSTAGSLTIRNATISGNTGGAVTLHMFSGTALVQNSTVTANVSLGTSSLSGGIWVGAPFAGSPPVTLVLESSIVAGNTQPRSTNPSPDLAATSSPSITIVADHSLIGVADTVTLSASSADNRTGTLAAPLDPRLRPLADNGGPTPTHLPHLDSPAIDHGSNPAGLPTDQRGNGRVLGAAPDIGAVERTPGVPDAAPGPLAAVTEPGGTTYEFTVTYADDTAVDVATVGAGDVRVTGPGGYTQVATFVGVTPAGNGTPRTATYRIVPPGGSWDAADFGTYTVSVELGQVFDTAGAAVPTGPIGSFRVAIPAVFTVTSPADAGPGSLRQAILDANAAPSADVIRFDPALIATGPATVSLLTSLPEFTDDVTVAGPGAGLVTVRRDPAATGAVNGFTVGGDPYRAVAVSGLTVSGSGGDGIGFLVRGAGGLSANAGTLTLSDVVVRDFRRTLSGAGVWVGAAGSLVMRNSTVTGNSAGGVGGGIYFAVNGSLHLADSTVSGNTAAGANGGGGVYFFGTVSAGGFTVRNSTISGNVAPSGGGVAFRSVSGTALIQNSTITANTATATSTAAGQGGGGLAVTTANSGSRVDLQSTVVAGNAAANGRPDLAATAVTVTADHSLIGAADTVTLSPASANTLTGTVATPLDPRLGPLADNGGPTRTHALLAGSPALNVGSNPANLPTDQRGSPRVVGPAVDIGAYEYKPVGVQSVQVNGGGGQRSMVRSLTVTFSGSVTFANNDPAAAFQLARVTGPGGTVGLTAAVSADGLGQTVVTLTFTGGTATDPSSLHNGTFSLADGRYRLAILAGAVAGPGGLALDGDNDGTAGGAYTSPDDTAAGGPGQLRLYRLFGDATGNGVVDLSDLAVLRTTFNAGVGSPAYLDYLDADRNGVVDLSDLGQFRGRFNVSVF
jgi:hypothetical protein